MKPSLEVQARWAPWVLLLGVIILWQIICSALNVSDFIFPSPSRIAEQAIEFHAEIIKHAWRTFWVTMVGFSIAMVVGVLLGFLVGSSRLAYAAIYPLMTAFNALPKAAFIPILVVWFGIGVGPAILTSFLISFFPITVNIATGLVGTTVSEMTASNEGIGYLLISAGSSMQMGLAFAGLVVVGAMAMVMYELFAFIETRTTAWAHRGHQHH
jgi:NitT/TauT family transport system permease protein